MIETLLFQTLLESLAAVEAEVEAETVATATQRNVIFDHERVAAIKNHDATSEERALHRAFVDFMRRRCCQQRP